MSDPSNPTTKDSHMDKPLPNLAGRLGQRPQKNRQRGGAPQATPEQTAAPQAPRQPSTRDTKPSETQAAVTSNQTPPAEKKAGKKAPRRSEGKGGKTEPGGGGEVTRSVVFYLPVGLHDELRAATQQTPDATNADIILDAIEHTVDRLSDLVAKHRDPAPSKSMFSRAPRQRQGPRVQLSARITERDLKIIDDLRTSLGADSRTQLVEVALHAYFADLTPQKSAS